MRTLSRLCLIAVAIVVGLSVTAVISQSALQSLERPISGSSSILVVTAHPDDETIFFSPTILSLRQKHLEVHLLCFTTGNFRGIGDRRAVELKAAVAALGVDDQHLVIVNDTRIQDGKQEEWPLPIMAERIAAEVSKRHIDTVVTFDHKGVYGHPNHKACQEAVRVYADGCARNAEGSGTCPSTWQLFTEPHRKFMGAVTIIQTAARCQKLHQACYITPSVVGTMRAMTAHASQWRWWTHILSKTYVSVNALDRLPGFEQDRGAAQASASELSMRDAFAQDGDVAPHHASSRAFHSARRARALHTRHSLQVSRLLRQLE
ncbi:hypothetical protein WJX73_003888 [Symbiochloris irregularis]|uniref:N-acetylglucosaminylphosphatidylinositol deacetylase n=1 Tax=Symbiochloris irregularis TaxID=706552 RepID=A0AAW1NYD6_9CHLO